MAAQEEGEIGRYHITLTPAQIAMYELNSFRCDFCFSCESDEDNQLVVCELCFSAVHKNCYMQDLLVLSKTQQEGWLCQRCQFIQRDPLRLVEPPKCLFCPEHRGIMIRLGADPCKGSWVHITCVNFLSMRKTSDKNGESKKIDFAVNPNGFKIINQLSKYPNFPDINKFEDKFDKIYTEDEKFIMSTSEQKFKLCSLC